MAAVDARAAAEGIAPGLPLADARALLPSLQVRESDPRADAGALDRLARWCGRYTPIVARDGADGLLLDITGCAHLFGGEAALLAGLTQRLQGFGLTVRAALADTPASAWAWSHAGPGGVLPEGSARSALAPLSVTGLRLVDLSHHLAALGDLDGDGEAFTRSLARADEVRRPGADPRQKPRPRPLCPGAGTSSELWWRLLLGAGIRWNQWVIGLKSLGA